MTTPASLPLPLAYDPQSFDAFNAGFEDAELLPAPAKATVSLSDTTQDDGYTLSHFYGSQG